MVRRERSRFGISSRLRQVLPLFLPIQLGLFPPYFINDVSSGSNATLQDVEYSLKKEEYNF